MSHIKRRLPSVFFMLMASQWNKRNLCTIEIFLLIKFWLQKVKGLYLYQHRSRKLVKTRKCVFWAHPLVYTEVENRTEILLTLNAYSMELSHTRNSAKVETSPDFRQPIGCEPWIGRCQICLKFCLRCLIIAWSQMITQHCHSVL